MFTHLRRAWNTLLPSVWDCPACTITSYGVLRPYCLKCGDAMTPRELCRGCGRHAPGVFFGYCEHCGGFIRHTRD